MLVRNGLFCCAILLGSIVQVDAQDQQSSLLRKNQKYIYGDTLSADVYLPVGYRYQKNPVLIFFTGGDYRAWDHYVNWAKLATSRGFVAVTYNPGVVFDKDFISNVKKRFGSVIHYLSQNEAQYSIDINKISLYAASGNALAGLAAANENNAVKAALIYCGTSPIHQFRTDLPVMMVRSGLDNPSLNQSIDSLAYAALKANAPYTIVNFTAGVHGFEDVTDAVALDVMEQSLTFLKLSVSPQAREKFSLKESNVIALREMYNANWAAAVAAFELALEKTPEDAEIERQMANAYIELKEYEKALKFYQMALSHGNWRKGEIAVKRIIAYAALNKPEEAVEQMKVLKKIGWFRAENYADKKKFGAITNSQAYRNFIGLK